MLLTARKILHPFPARIPANRRRFHSSSSSPPCKRRRVSPCSSLSPTHSSSSVSARLSRKRCRSLTADFLLVRADLLPSCKRLRDLSSTYCHEVSVEVSTKVDIEDRIETGAKGDIERDTESDIDSDILADIEADIVAEAAITIETNVAADAVAVVEGIRDDEAEDDIESSDRGKVEIGIDVVIEPEVPDDIPVPIIADFESRETFEIGLDVVIHELYDHMVEFPALRITYIVEEQRAQETSAITTNTKRARLLDKIRVLEGSNIGLRDALGVEREMTASVERHLGYMLEELRRIRMAYQYDRADFRKLETFVMRHLANHNTDTIIGSENQYGDKEGYSNGGGNGNGKSRGNGNSNGGGNRNHGNGNRNRMNVGAGGNALVARVCTYKDFLNYQPRNINGNKGVLGLARWFEKIEYMRCISNCHVDSQVKFATCTLLDGALTW
ncbi:hypothetical protein Tco_1488262 [Tanacetum coccineum]